MQPHETEALRRAYRQSSLIALAMAGTVLVYAAVIALLKDRLGEFTGLLADGDATTLRYAFLAVAVLCVFLARILKIRILTLKRSDLNTVSREQLLSFLTRRLTVAHMVSCAFAEAPAIMGLVYVLLTGDTPASYMLLVISIYLFVVHMPRYGHWELLAEQALSRVMG